MSCNQLPKGDLDAYVHGELSAVEVDELEAHVVDCHVCATELRQLRQEKRLFRLRADAEQEQVPAFAEVLARIHREETRAVAHEEESNRVVVFAKAPRPLPVKAKEKSIRSGEGKNSFSRWAQAFVACAATAAAAGSLLSVTPPKTEPTAITSTHGEEMEIGADPICTPENSSASAEVLASVAPPRAGFSPVSNPNNDNVETCGEPHVEECEELDRICGESSSPMCAEREP